MRHRSITRERIYISFRKFVCRVSFTKSFVVQLNLDWICQMKRELPIFEMNGFGFQSILLRIRCGYQTDNGKNTPLNWLTNNSFSSPINFHPSRLFILATTLSSFHLQMLTVCHCASSAENFANRLLETQLRNAAREQVKMANRLTQAAIHEMQINANKLPLTKNFQTTVVNALASRGITDVSWINLFTRNFLEISYPKIFGIFFCSWTTSVERCPRRHFATAIKQTNSHLRMQLGRHAMKHCNAWKISMTRSTRLWTMAGWTSRMPWRMCKMLPKWLACATN